MEPLVRYDWIALLLVTMLSSALCILLIPIARSLGWVDHPGVRKVHMESTPLVGGFVIFLILGASFLIPVYGLGDSTWHDLVLMGAAIVFLTGAIDDRWGLSPLIRFFMQILACLLVIQYTGIQLRDFGSLFSSGTLELGILSLPITVFAALGVINAFNLVDGMDGLAGSLFLVAAIGMVLFAAGSVHLDVFNLLAFSSAAVLGFLLLNARLPWNPNARVFLGDAGSLMLGFILAWSFIRLGNGESRVFMPITAVWLFAIPLLDTSTLIWRRWREGRSALHADQNHLHHVFLRAGYSVVATWGLIILFAVTMAAIGIVFEVVGLPGWVSFYAFIIVAFSYYFYLKHAWSSQKFLGRHFIHHDFEIDENAVINRKV